MAKPAVIILSAQAEIAILATVAMLLGNGKFANLDE